MRVPPIYDLRHIDEFLAVAFLTKFALYNVDAGAIGDSGSF